MFVRAYDSKDIQIAVSDVMITEASRQAQARSNLTDKLEEMLSLRLQGWAIVLVQIENNPDTDKRILFVVL